MNELLELATKLELNLGSETKEEPEAYVRRVLNETTAYVYLFQINSMGAGAPSTIYKLGISGDVAARLLVLNSQLKHYSLTATSGLKVKSSRAAKLEIVLQTLLSQYSISPEEAAKRFSCTKDAFDTFTFSGKTELYSIPKKDYEYVEDFVKQLHDVTKKMS